MLTLQNALNSPTSIAVCSGTLAPLRTFLRCVTVLPKPINKILTLACTNVEAVVRAGFLVPITDYSLKPSIRPPKT
ncbi:hypothetical protein Moror_2956 [Moniliophthora roreri MCA 2997]|uniref:Uncharacterized protein n=2 Tax=Moniliophthora roreri TaxID=221103 RepID=V2WKM2_MONRO|nr:hypothetical protein Moror_2956 [Moniliophthora roreri MCA 2997]